MGINASIKQNEIYINNNLSFTINNSHVWFGKERCELLDVFGNVLLNFVVKHRFLRTTKFDVKQNNINNKYELVYSDPEEHTSELQSRPHLVCRLLLEK